MKSKSNVVLSKNTSPDIYRFDKLLWLVIAAFIFSGLFVHYYFSNWMIHVGTWIIVILLSIFSFCKTKKGKWGFKFIQESRLELYKIIWPTKEETIQTTMVIGLMVFVFAVILWALDGSLVWMIGWLTGQHN